MDPNRRASLRAQIKKRFPNPNILRFLDVCNLSVNRVEFLNPYDLAVYVGVGTQHHTQLGLRSDELLVFLLNARNQHQWFHKEIRKRIREQERIDRAAVLVLSRDKSIRKKCADPRPDPNNGYLTSLVTITFSEIAKSLPNGCYLALQGAFREQAFSTDHFSTTTPVTSDNLFGRRPLLAQIENDLLTHSQPVGIFGLRRAGKTSVLHQLILQLRAHTEPRFVVALADLQRDNYNVTADRVAKTYARSLAKAAIDMGSRFRDRQHETPFDHVTALIRHLNRKGVRVVLALDEVEWLVPPPESPDARTRAQEFMKVFGGLRGLKHEFGPDVGLICCGINQSFAEKPSLLSYPNPVLDFFKCHYVAGLNRDDLIQMTEALGARMGLAFHVDFLDRLYVAFGGHPYFSRQFCSWIALRERRRPLRILPKHFDTHYDSFLNEKWGLMEQVMEYFAHFYPDEFESIVSVAQSSRTADSFSSRHLESYGLVELDGDEARIRIDCIRQWLLRRASPHGQLELIADRLQPIRELGTGATGTVLLAEDRVVGERRALKMFHKKIARDAVISEFNILRTIRSQYTVQAYDVVESGEGRLCLVMEYIGL